MKKTKYIILILLIIITILFSYKFYQKKKFANYKPKIVTKKELLSLLKNHNSMNINSVIIPNNYNSFLNLQNSFGAGSIYVFNKKREVIDNNIISENGSCLSDISLNICENNLNHNSEFKEKIKDRFNLLISNTKNLNNQKIKYETYDYLVLYSWAKYLPPTYDIKTLEFLKCKNSKMLIISLNMDLLDEWNIPREIKKEISNYEK